jgi:hypothetical protein
MLEEINQLIRTLRTWWSVVTHWVQWLLIISIVGIFGIAIFGWLATPAVTFFVTILVLTGIVGAAIFLINFGILMGIIKTPYIKEVIGWIAFVFGAELFFAIYFALLEPLTGGYGNLKWIINLILCSGVFFSVAMKIGIGKGFGKIAVITLSIIFLFITSYFLKNTPWREIFWWWPSEKVIAQNTISQSFPQTMPQKSNTTLHKNTAANTQNAQWYDLDTMWTRINLPKNTHREYFHNGTVMFRYENGNVFEADADGACFLIMKNGKRGERLENDYMGTYRQSHIRVRAKEGSVRLEIDITPS